MFDWFHDKEDTLTEFQNSEAAFAHACTLHYPLLLNARIPALVVGEGRRGAEGEHWYRLRLACQEGVLDIWGPTLPEAPGHPEVGDLVAFRIVRFATELPEDASLIGYIESRLEPVLNSRKGWRIALSFRSDNLKPELHL
ncbi:MAG: hypothetical protein JJE30_10685 [Desulfuromonadales bacterium]|nr:hypothetical protein [Desulfuromonadales bacterium]